MISTQIIGGLGNQLFQMAAGLALARRHKTDLILDVSGYQNYRLHPFRLDRLGLPFGISATGLSPTYREPHFHYDPKFSTLPDGTALAGYWQSPRYFESVESEIRSLIRIPEGDIPVPERRAQSVALHIRRGDYVQNATTLAVHGTSSLDYYAAAMHLMAKHVDNPVFYVVTDDPVWAQENLRSRHELRFVTSPAQDPDFHDFFAMARCSHAILANSTYSWWAAFLNPNPNKIVTYPLPWFRKADRDTRDLFPNAWMAIQC